MWLRPPVIPSVSLCASLAGLVACSAPTTPAGQTDRDTAAAQDVARTPRDGRGLDAPPADGPVAEDALAADTAPSADAARVLDAAPGPDGAPAPTARYPSVSGIYPHLAAFNDSTAARYGECGIGAVVPWAGSLWFLTYPPHERRGSADKLYQVTPELDVTVRAESVGGTHAGRLIHTPSKQLVIGPYFVDQQARVRAVDVRNALPARITAVAQHLTDPAGKVLLFDMEGPLWEVDVQTLQPRRLFVKPVPGWHGKGAYTGQGRVVIANNGEARARDLDALAWELPESQWSRGPEDAGALAEWDGTTWTVVSRRQHTEVTGPGGIEGAPSADAPLWSMGWDRRSVLLQVRHGGAWHTYRVPKGSYTYDPRHGWYTEWPRIREIGGGRYLMNMHGTFFDFPAGFRPGATGGLRPLSTHLHYTTDFAAWNGRLVLAGDDASILENPLVGRANSNLRFIAPAELETAFGPPAGFGGVWVRDAVVAGAVSDPLLVAGYTARTLHLAHDADAPVTFALEADRQGDGQFRAWQQVTVPPRGYVPYLVPADGTVTWLRLRVDRAATVTAYLHLAAPGPAPAGAPFAALAPIDAAAPGDGLLLSAGVSRDLQFLERRPGPDGAPEETYYEVDERLAIRPVDAPDRAAALRTRARIAVDLEIDAASVVVKDATGRRWRLPRGPAAFDAPSRAGALRGIREVASERFLANLHGTFYEIPRVGTSTPDFARMRPVASHRSRITDFASWRGLLVLAGVSASAPPDGHHVRAQGRPSGLWFGALDDLHRLGRPVGEGGPWRDTPVTATAPSDPYLMTGYGRKTLTLSHDAAAPVTFTVEVDPLADGTWYPWARIVVPPGAPLAQELPAGFGAHWVRTRVDRACRATAQLRYD